jgi:hypothetical protein
VTDTGLKLDHRAGIQYGTVNRAINSKTTAPRANRNQRMHLARAGGTRNIPDSGNCPSIRSASG